VPAELHQSTASAKVAAAVKDAAGSNASASDPLDRLGKLADLHDRGALTDAEFAAEKAKILGES
jgi:Short C-terminal domain